MIPMSRWRDQRLGIARAVRLVLVIVVLSIWVAKPGFAAGPTGTVPSLTPETAPPLVRYEPPAAVVRSLTDLQTVGADDPRRLRDRFATGKHEDPVTTLLSAEELRGVPFVWKNFFRTAVITVGREAGQRIYAGLYSPLIDLWIVTEWRRHQAIPGGGEPLVDLSSAWLVSGETMREGAPIVGDQRQWTAATDAAPVALLRLSQASLEAFYAADSANIAPGRNASDQGGAVYRHRLALRLLDFSGTLLFLDSDPLRTQVQILRASMVSADLAGMKQQNPGVEAADVDRLAKLPVKLRSQFEVTSFLPLPYGALLTLGVPGGGRWVLIGLCINNNHGSLDLKRLVFVDVIQPLKNRDAAR